MKRYLLLVLLFIIAPLSYAGFFSFGSGKHAFLPADEAFVVQVRPVNQHILLASFKITPDYYLYRNKISFTSSDPQFHVDHIDLPKGDSKNDPNFGLLEVYHQSFQAQIVLDKVADNKPLTLQASYQGCSEKGLCYPPIEKTFAVEFVQTLNAGSGDQSSFVVDASIADNENTRIAQLFKGGNFWLIISFFFGAGLLLAFTPCIFPMVPILSGIIVGQGKTITRTHAFVLSLAYVLGMAITYAVAGVAAGLSGSMISSAMQTPWVLGSFAALFVLLSLSMFGLYELQLPTALQSRLTDTSNRLRGGQLSGVFAMGALSAIIVGPCVAAPLAGALLYISQTHDAVLGGAALFVLALGMGAPLLLIGTSAGALLPKAGAWMESVKRVFGVMMLAMAIWIVSPVISLTVEMLLWAGLLIFASVYLQVFTALAPNARPAHKLGKLLGVFALLIGVIYLIGALSGARDIFHPLGNIMHSSTPAPAKLAFERVKNSAELDERIAQARGRMVMLDFYAEWCVSCKEMERFTFSDAKVQARLKNVVLLQADVTANNADDKALLQRFQLFGPPGILFFDNQGKELVNLRVTGYQDAAQFMQSLKNTGL